MHLLPLYFLTALLPLDLIEIEKYHYAAVGGIICMDKDRACCRAGLALGPVKQDSYFSLLLGVKPVIALPAEETGRHLFHLVNNQWLLAGIGKNDGPFEDTGI